MGLINNTSPAFEAEDTTAAAVFANAPQINEVDKAAAEALKVQQAAGPAALDTKQPLSQPDTAVPSTTVAPTTAVAATNTNALIIAEPAYALSEGMKDALVVDFNTFPQITANNGNFVERETKTVLGDMVEFELLSYQDSWVVDPGNDQAPKELVRYSDDGVVCSDGTPVHEHLHFLKAGGYPLASLKQRSVVVAEVISCSKTKKYNGELVQFDLSPMSRVQWQRYLANSVNTLRKGRKTVEQLKLIRATAQPAVGKDNKQYVKATFASMDTPTE